MIYRSDTPPRWWAVLQALAVYAWLTVLAPLSVTDSYYSVYLLCGSLGLVCLWDNYRAASRPGVVQAVAGLVFSGAVAAANYPLYTPLSVLQNVFDFLLLLAGGFVVGTQVLAWMAEHLPLDAAPGLRRKPGRVFFLSFGLIAAINLCYLFLARYPGIMTTDSFATMDQILGNSSYNNTMPFWHTVTVGVFVDLGLVLGLVLGLTLNGAVALYHSVQVLFVAACLAYVVTTMYQTGAHRLWIAVVFALYAFLPYNIAYSVTLWKDVPFAASAVLLVTALYRKLVGIGRWSWLNTLAFTLGAFGFCLLRTNGWYAFVVTTVVMAVLLWREHRALVVTMALISLVSWLLIGPVLTLLGVAKTNLTEAFAIPMQQAARVIWMERPLSEEDAFLMSKAFLQDRVREFYDPNNVDGVKYYAFRRNRIPFILENWKQYVGFYFRLAWQYPGDFFVAWVEQTKGYWNGGYDYYTYTQTLGENALGLFQMPGENLVARGFAALFRYMEKPEILQCLRSIGLHTWALGACAVTTVKKRREVFALTVPILVLVLGLLLGSPVYAEFRYAYPMILTMPMILTATMYAQKERTQFR